MLDGYSPSRAPGVTDCNGLRTSVLTALRSTTISFAFVHQWHTAGSERSIVAGGITNGFYRTASTNRVES